jgi:hypothetical protein
MTSLYIKLIIYSRGKVNIKLKIKIQERNNIIFSGIFKFLMYSNFIEKNLKTGKAKKNKVKTERIKSLRFIFIYPVNINLK